jgi:acetyl esterase/lipase
MASLGEVMTLDDWKLPPERDGVPPDDALAARRAMVDAGAQSPTVAPGVTVTETDLDGVTCVRCSPAEPPIATIMFFHGGGYRVASARGYISLASPIARACRAEVVLVDYRLAPEHPYPAALHDAVRAYDALPRRDLPLIVAGDSAGGGLAFAIIAAALATGHTLPDAVIALSPWVDLTVSAPTYVSRAITDLLFPEPSAREAAELYLQGADARDPLASPLFADLDGCPPALLFAGGSESLLGDALALASKLTETGTSVELHAVAGMQHVWPLIFAHLPESATALAAMARFVERIADA